MSDPINPDHYRWHPSGVECIRITEHFNFNLGNAIKYVWRAGWKDSKTHIEDLEKAIWYIQNEIGLLKAKALHPATKPTAQDNLKLVKEALKATNPFKTANPFAAYGQFRCSGCHKFFSTENPHVCEPVTPAMGPFKESRP